MVGKGVEELLAEGYEWFRIVEIAAYQHELDRVEAKKLEQMLKGFR